VCKDDNNNRLNINLTVSLVALLLSEYPKHLIVLDLIILMATKILKLLVGRHFSADWYNIHFRARVYLKIETMSVKIVSSL